MTTRSQCLVNTLALFLVAPVLLAQNFWNDQDYRKWTAVEVSRLTSDSPWAKKLNNLTITWLTALPIKQAMLKDRMDAGGILAESAQEIMNTEEKVYVIVITGLSAEEAKNITEISLKVEGKPIMKPASGNLQNRGQAVDAMVIFPRTDPITGNDGEVEVILKIGPDEIGKKFPLKDMVYKGKLEL